MMDGLSAACRIKEGFNREGLLFCLLLLRYL